MSIGERLKKFRTHVKLSHTELSKVLGKDKITVQRYKNNVSNIPDSIITLLKISYNLNPEWLKEGTSKMLIIDDSLPICEFPTDYDSLSIENVIGNYKININTENPCLSDNQLYIRQVRFIEPHIILSDITNKLNPISIIK